jgi:signal transduction histidine kinase
LHDGPSQLLASMVMGLRFLRQVIAREPERTDTELNELDRLANTALHQLRNMLFDLRPVALETQGLAAALQVYVERQKDMKQIEFHLDTQAFAGRFTPKVEAASFSIIQEAVNNVEKHAQAKNIWISVKSLGDKLAIAVKDDGRGFDIEQVQESYSQKGNLGLLNMKERTEIAGGKLKIESKPGRGTSVTLDLPLDTMVSR